MLGFLAALAAALSLTLFIRARDEAGRVYWLASAVVAAAVFVGWVLFWR